VPTFTQQFFEEERKIYPKAWFRFKDDIGMSKMIAFYQRPFNPLYLHTVTTTIPPETRFGTELRGEDLMQLNVEFHENVHKYDAQLDSLFTLKYAYPQILCVPVFVGLFAASGWCGLAALLVLLTGLHVGLFLCHKNRDVTDPRVPAKSAVKKFNIIAGCSAAVALGLTIVGGGWWSLLWLAVGLFLNPYPPMTAKWRRDAEIRGYTATLYRAWLKHGSIRDESFEYIVSGFTGPSYFWMEPDKNKVSEALLFQIDRFTNNEDEFLLTWKTGPRDKGSVSKAVPFRMMKNFIENNRGALWDAP